MTAHVVYCRGCQRAWVDSGVGGMNDPPDDACACTCDDPTAPTYEDWVVDPDPADIPPGAFDP